MSGIAEHVAVAHREQTVIGHHVYVLEPTVAFHQLMEHVYVEVDTYSLTQLVECKLRTLMVLRTAKSGYAINRFQL